MHMLMYTFNETCVPQQNAFSSIIVHYSINPNARKHQIFCWKNLAQNLSIHIAVRQVGT